MFSILASCAEKKQEPQGGAEDFDLSEAARISGNRLKQELEGRDERISGSAEGETTKEPAKTPSEDDETPNPFAIDGDLPTTHDPNETPSGYKILGGGGYREALTDEEYKEALAAAKSYAKKNYPSGTGDFNPASDSDSLYGENKIYGKGNIIVVSCRTPNGTVHSIAVARANAKSEFKVVGAN